jgi:hypothetical protein
MKIKATNPPGVALLFYLIRGFIDKKKEKQEINKKILNLWILISSGYYPPYQN